MNRIADALERARKEKPQDLESHASGIAELRQQAVRASEVRYTQTRRVEVSREFLHSRRIVTGSETGPYAAAYKILCTQIVQRLHENNWNAVAVTSPGTGEGKTITAINLAIGLGLEVDQTVLLVDANLRQPRIHECFDLPPGAGLSDYLLKGTALAEILVHPSGLGKVVILPGGRPIVNSSEMLGSRRMMELVKELKSRYPSRIVVFDLPPVLSAADALAFSPYVDAAVLVAGECETGQDEIVRALEMLGATRVIGTVLTKSRAAGVARDAPQQRRGWFSRRREERFEPEI